MNNLMKTSKFWWIVLPASVVCYFAVASISSAPGRPAWVYNVVGFFAVLFLLVALASLVIAIIFTRSERRRKRAQEYYDAGLQAMSAGDWETAKASFMQANSQGHMYSDAKLDEVIMYEATQYYDAGIRALSENKRDEAENWFIKAKVWEHPWADAKLAELKNP